MSVDALKQGIKDGDTEIQYDSATWEPITCGEHTSGYDSSCDNCIAQVANTVDHIREVENAASR